MSERGPNDENPGARRDDALRAAAMRLGRRQSQRADSAVRQLADPYPHPLSDRQRAAIERLSNRLIGDIEDELRAALLTACTEFGNESLEASLAAGHVAIAKPVL